MLNNRHLTTEEKNAVRDIVDEAGPVEVLRLLGSLVSNLHPSDADGDWYRQGIFKIAQKLNDQKQGQRISGGCFGRPS